MPIAYMLIICDLGPEKEIIKQLSKVEEVKQVYDTFGDYDIIAKVVSDSMDTLKHAISKV